MSKLRYYLNQNTLTMIYYGLVYPYLTYGATIWGNASKVSIDPLYIYQKKAVRLITNNNIRNDDFVYPHSAPLFNNLRILTVYDIFKLELLKFVFDSLRKLNPVQFHSFFNYTNDNVNTASVRDFKLNPPQVRTTTYGLESLKYKGAVLWNSIPLSIRSATSKKQFSNKLKNLFIKAYV